jgi:ankyrin repeat protein
MALELSQQAYSLCCEQNASGLRAFLVIGMVPSPFTFNIMGLAAHHESPECLQVLLDFGADVNNQERVNSVSPLMRAAHFGRVECVRLLLEKNADVALADSRADMALHNSSYEGHSKYLRLLIEN